MNFFLLIIIILYIFDFSNERYMFLQQNRPFFCSKHLCSIEYVTPTYVTVDIKQKNKLKFTINDNLLKNITKFL